MRPRIYGSNKIHVVRNLCVCAICERPNVHVMARLSSIGQTDVRTRTWRSVFIRNVCTFDIKKLFPACVLYILAVAAVDVVVVVVDVGIEFSMRADGTHYTHSIVCIIVLGASNASHCKRFFIQSVHWRIF